MRNKTRFTTHGQPANLYRSLDSEARASLNAALDRIGSNPHPDGDTIFSVTHPPVVIYTYQDEHWRISFGRSYSITEECYDIEIFAIKSR